MLDDFRSQLETYRSTCGDLGRRIGSKEGWAEAAEDEEFKTLFEGSFPGKYMLCRNWAQVVDKLEKYGAHSEEDSLGARGAFPAVFKLMGPNNPEPVLMLFIHGTECQRLKNAARFIGPLLASMKVLFYKDESQGE